MINSNTSHISSFIVFYYRSETIEIPMHMIWTNQGTTGGWGGGGVCSLKNATDCGPNAA